MNGAPKTLKVPMVVRFHPARKEAESRRVADMLVSELGSG